MTKPVITTRASKGAALTWTEGDNNLTNLRDATITLTAGSGGTAVSSDLNGTITLLAGTNISISGDNAGKTVTINAAGGSGITDVVQDTTPQLGGNLDVNGQSIVSTSNGNINIVPDGSGDVYLSSDVVVVGDAAAAATLTTNGAGNLIINTNGGTSSGSITINTGSTGTLTIDSPGNTFLQTTGSSSSYLNYIYRTDSTLNNAPVAVFRKKRTDGLLSTLNGVTVPVSAQIVGSDNTAVQFSRQLNTYSTTANAHTIQWQVSSDSFSTNVQLASLESNLIALGETSGTTAQTVTTPRAGNLILSTNRGTNSGTMTITAGANGNITVSPNGTGKTVISSMNYNEGALYDLGTTGGTIAPNVSNGNVQKITLNSALTLNAFTSPVAGQSLTLIIYGGTAYTSITSTMKFAGGIKTLTATAGCIDILSVYYDGTNYFASLGKGFA
jgi:hypothetical protein